MAIAGPSGASCSTAGTLDIADDKFYDKIYFDSDDDENDDEVVGESGTRHAHWIKSNPKFVLGFKAVFLMS